MKTTNPNAKTTIPYVGSTMVPQVLRSPGVFLASRSLPYIFMEWNWLGRDGNCPDLAAFIELMEAEGYGARDAATLGAVDRWGPDVGGKRM